MIQQLLTNNIFIAGIMALVVCHVWKVIHKSIKTKTLALKELYSTGGMPSSHTALVTAFTFRVGVQEGFSSAIFIISLFVSGIIIRDALGVRRTVDYLIQHMNKIIDKKNIKIAKINQIAGHTPLQVFVGFLVGVMITIIIHLI